MMNTFKILATTLLVLSFSGCEENKLDVDKFGSISGTIFNGNDYSPLEGVLITTTPASTTALTDENGEFRFDKVIDGEVTLTARKKDFLSTSISVAVFEDEVTVLSFYLLEDENDIGWVTIFDPVPGNGAVNQDISLAFQWKVDQQFKDKQLNYTVYYFTSGSTVQQLAGENLNSTEVVIDKLSYETTYYWYVIAKNEGRIVANSPTWTFKTKAEEQE